MVISWNELRDARERKNLTQEELAAHLGVSTRTITNWERVGVARKSEYKVRRFFGDDMESSTQSVDAIAEFDYNEKVRRMSLSDRADHEGTTEFALALKEASDAELLEELQRRARKRGLAVISAEVSSPKFMQREVGQILRGERRRLTAADFNVSGLGKAMDPHEIDLSQGDVDLAATTDNTTVQEQSHPNYEEETQDPEA